MENEEKEEEKEQEQEEEEEEEEEEEKEGPCKQGHFTSLNCATGCVLRHHPAK